MNKFIKAKIIKRSIEGKEVSLELKQSKVYIKSFDAKEGLIEAFVSIFNNVDSYGEIVDPGAFIEFLTANFDRYPKGVWAHDWSLPIAKTLAWKEVYAGDESLPDSIKELGGLYIKGKLVKGVQKADEALLLLEAGVITDFSFGFHVVADYIDQNTGYRHLKAVEIYEWSPVLVGANPKTELVGLKGDGQEQGTDEGTQEGTGEEQKPPEETPAQENPPEATPPEDPNNPQPTPPEKSDPVPEEKQGRVLSGKNRTLIESAVAGMKDAVNALEALLEATEESSAAKDDNLEVDQRVRKGIKLIIRDARQADKAIERLLVRAKQNT